MTVLLLETYPWTHKNQFNFESHPHPDDRTGSRSRNFSEGFLNTAR